MNEIQKDDVLLPGGIGNEDDYEEIEFRPCAKCDGHPACEDFGCAIELGLGRMVKKNFPAPLDDWS